MIEDRRTFNRFSVLSDFGAPDLSAMHRGIVETGVTQERIVVNSYLLIAGVLLQTAAPVDPSPTSVGFELAIWKWVVIIGAGAVVLTYIIKRIADVVAVSRTRQIIDTVVGNGEGSKGGDWIDNDYSDDADGDDDVDGVELKDGDTGDVDVDGADGDDTRR